MKDLIERLEAATGPDPQLDWAIAEVLGLVPPHSIREIGWDYDWWRAPGGTALWRAKDSEGRSVELWKPLPYTASLDAALTLVPEGWSWGITHESERRNEPFAVSVRRFWTSFDRDYYVRSTTPAIALCIAALKARAAGSEG